jgi:hypothetical protein
MKLMYYPRSQTRLAEEPKQKLSQYVPQYEQINSQYGSSTSLLSQSEKVQKCSNLGQANKNVLLSRITKNWLPSISNKPNQNRAKMTFHREPDTL